MSPILVRPVREQLEHDRVIRLLQAKYKRKFEVAINPGTEQTTPVSVGPLPWYPDLVLQSPARGRKLLGVVEVETAESVNHLEAMSQWAAFARLRAPFHLYVPAASVDTARRLCSDLQIAVAEIWAYHPLGDQLRFTLIQRLSHGADGKGAGAAAAPRRPAPSARRQAGDARGARASATRPARRAAATARRTRPGGTKKAKATRDTARTTSSAAPKAQKRK
ncbi:MAG: hypothetical protein HY657_11995 [Acidobacteria bacterium]|nr:hypothetical protein [Acidobacteriota bacterium]